MMPLARQGPIVAESWSSSSPPPITEGLVLVTRKVASVSLDGASPIPVYRRVALPGGLRGLDIEIRGVDKRQDDNGRRPRFTPIGRDGRRISGKGTTWPPLLRQVPSSRWSSAARTLRGPCDLRATALPGLEAQAGTVVKDVRRYRGLIGAPLLSCASVEYRLDGWPLLAGLLLNAANPQATPPNLPGMRAIKGRQGVVQAPNAESQEPAVARRAGNAWLIVTGGKGLQQRLTVLEHLRATVGAGKSIGLSGGFR